MSPSRVVAGDRPTLDLVGNHIGQVDLLGHLDLDRHRRRVVALVRDLEHELRRLTGDRRHRRLRPRHGPTPVAAIASTRDDSCDGAHRSTWAASLSRADSFVVAQSCRTRVHVGRRGRRSGSRERDRVAVPTAGPKSLRGDATTVDWPDVGRLCERPGCSEPGAASYGMVPEDLLFWVDTFHPADAARHRCPVSSARRRDGRAARLDARRPP